jgi:hypothetical protein
LNILVAPLSQSYTLGIKLIKMKEKKLITNKKGPENLIPDPKYVI